VLAGACAALALGAVPWGWSLYLRGARVADFAFGRLPGWPFRAYVLLTVAGIGPLGASLVMGSRVALGWLTVGLDALSSRSMG